MAYVTRTHGDFKQQMNFDTPEYTVGSIDAVTDDGTVQPQGPKLDFFTITGNGTTSNVGTYANVVISTIQQLATVYLYEFETSATDATLAIAVYPTGAWTTATLVTALEADPGPAWANAVTVSASATFTN